MREPVKQSEPQAEERTRIAKRARANERTKSCERANPEERTTARKRATASERTIERKRARTGERTKSGKRPNQTTGLPTEDGVTTEPIVREGEIIACENGHKLYRITRDVFLNETILPSQFERIDEKAQEPGYFIGILPCPHCGAPWVRGGITVGVHTERGWTG